jgi:hypothetical protein
MAAVALPLATCVEVVVARDSGWIASEGAVDVVTVPGAWS